MIIRLRSRDGLERVEVPNNATVNVLKITVEGQLGIPYHEQTLSRDQGLLKSHANSAQYKDLADPNMVLSKLGLSNGAMVFLRYGRYEHC